MSRRATISKKTLLGSVVIPLWVFAVQQFLQGRVYVGGVSAAIAVGLFAAYEYLGLRQLPVDPETLRELSEQLGGEVKEQVGSRSQSAAPPGVTRDPETGQFVANGEKQQQEADGG